MDDIEEIDYKQARNYDQNPVNMHQGIIVRKVVDIGLFIALVLNVLLIRFSYLVV